MTVKNLTKLYLDSLNQDYPCREIRSALVILFREYMNWNRGEIHLNPDFIIPPNIRDKFLETLRQLKLGIPLQYILNKAWFGNFTLYVDDHVLIPRPETEELCKLIISQIRQMKIIPSSILDIGTGSGCIALELKRAFPDAIVTAMDHSLPALNIASLNSRMCNAELALLRDDILNPESVNDPRQYDVIVSNPPYVTESEKKVMNRNVTEHEPPSALFVPDNDPLIYYVAICRYAVKKIKKTGRLYLEINERFGNETAALLMKFGFGTIEVSADMNGKDRFVSAVL